MPPRKRPFSLYRRRGIWYARLWDEGTATYTVAKSTGERDRDRAMLVAQKMLDSGVIKRREDDPFFVDLLLQYWRDRRDLSRAYQHDTIRDIEKHVVPYKPLRVRLSVLNHATVNRFIDYLVASGKTPRSINRLIQSMKTFLAWAYSRGYLDRDLADRRIKPLKAPLQARGALSPEEVFRLVTLSWKDPRMRACVALACLAGLRRGEIRALTWRDIDFKAGTIDVRRNFVGDFDEEHRPIYKAPKASSFRKFPYLVFPELRAALLELWESSQYRGPDDLVMISVSGSNHFNGVLTTQVPISDTTIKRNFNQMLAAIGISREDQRRRNLTFHGLRHSFVSLMETVLPTRSTMALSGHATRAVFEQYSHADKNVVSEHLAAANEALNKYRIK